MHLPAARAVQPVCLFILCASFLVPAEDKKAPPEIIVPKLTQAPPKIDGLLDDPAWKDAAKSEAFTRAYGEESDLKCFFRVMQDDKALYIAIECPEKDTTHLKSDVTEHDGDLIWEDDDVELFINPAGTRDFPYYQIILNPKGVTFDVEMKGNQDPDKSWEPKYEAKTHVDKNRWTVEIALPWSSFDRTENTASEWGFNVLHVRSIDEMLYWSPVYDPNSHQPGSFGKLKGMPVIKLKRN